jgi:hypothetical protein
MRELATYVLSEHILIGRFNQWIDIDKESRLDNSLKTAKKILELKPDAKLSLRKIVETELPLDELLKDTDKPALPE